MINLERYYLNNEGSRIFFLTQEDTANNVFEFTKSKIKL
jgi:hypothetical protein